VLGGLAAETQGALARWTAEHTAEHREMACVLAMIATEQANLDDRLTDLVREVHQLEAVVAGLVDRRPYVAPEIRVLGTVDLSLLTDPEEREGD
jgi:hypothetical protein